VLLTLLIAVPQSSALDWDTGNIREGIPDFATLLLDGQSRPRLFFQSSQVNFGSCNAGCLSAANWSFVSLAPLGFDAGSLAPRGALALNDIGNPRVAAAVAEVSGVQLLYGFCDSGCADLANWTTVVAVEHAGVVGATYNAATAVDAGGGVHVVYSFVRPADPPFPPTTYATEMRYASCAGGCDDPANWTSSLVLLYQDYYATYPLQLDSVSLQLYEPAPGQVAPRVLLEMAQIAGWYGVRTLMVASCDTNCASQAGWSFEEIAESSQYSGYAYSNMALDSSGNPHLALTVSVMLYPDFTQSLLYVPAGGTPVTLGQATVPEFGVPSIGLNSSDAPRIAVHSQASDTLNFHSCETGCSAAASWTSETAIPDIKGGTPSLVMAPGLQAPRIAYINAEEAWIQYASGTFLPAPWIAAGEAEASVAGAARPHAGSGPANALAFFLVPAALVAAWTGLSRRGAAKRKKKSEEEKSLEGFLA